MIREASTRIHPQADAERYGVEWSDQVDDSWLDPALVQSVPVEWARRNLALPVRRTNRLYLLLADPSAVHAQDDMAILLGQRLTPLAAPMEMVRQAIERCYYQGDHSAARFADGLSPSPSEPVLLPVSRASDLLELTDQAPVTQFINLVLLEAVKGGASDVHVEPFETRLRIRYRIDGILYEKASPPKTMELALVSRLKVMAHMDIAETRLPQDGMARVRVGDREIDIRVSTIPVAEGERVVLRLLNRDAAWMPLTSLGMDEGLCQQFKSAVRAPHGVVIVCGPTGSGKTTTLYAALDGMDAMRRNILTIEDPVEYQLPDIGQMQVKPKIGLTFAAGLRHLLRQDPDVILVGEIRDSETAEIAIRASLTGHLVLTTLHTQDAPGAFVRLVDMGIERYLLASSVRAVLAQRLVRCLCPACRHESEPSDEWRRFRARYAGSMPVDRSVWNASGCDRCLEGYRGRTGIFELLLVDPAMQEYIRRESITVAGVRDGSTSYRDMTLREDGLRKVSLGLTSPAELLAVLAG